MKNIIVFGANSAIAKSVIYEYARAGNNLILLARNIGELESLKKDLLVKNPNINVHLLCFDASIAGNQIDDILIDIKKLTTEIDVLLIAHGVLTDVEKTKVNYSLLVNDLQINALSVIEICEKIKLNLLSQNNSSTIAVISSVAGLRGRQSNYHYGTAKGMLNIYLQGLRNDLTSNHNAKVHVLTIMPGFVDTPMTASITKKGLLWSTPDKVAKDIIKAIAVKKNIIYTPWFWSIIMKIIIHIPENIFKKLKI